MNKRIRAVGIVINQGKVLLMYRKRPEKEYYIFPGGGVEAGEEVKDAVVRELWEETSIKVSVGELLYHLKFSDDTEQYFYLCDYLAGEPELGDFIEKEKMSRGNNFYQPLWWELTKLPETLLYPLEVRDWLIEDLKSNFSQVPREADFKVENIRQV